MNRSWIQKKTEAEQQLLLDYWARWKDRPTAPVLKASELSDEEQREFIIKDNVGYGEWDMNALANEWDAEDLNGWGLDLWEDKTGDGSGSDASHQNSAPESSLFDRFVTRW